MFCAECGADHHAGEREERTAVDREIELARINAKRDVDVARINARVDRDGLETAEAIAEVEAEAAVEAAVVEGEVVAAALEASDVEAEPIEIVAPDIAQNVDVDMSEELPPGEGSPVPAESKPRGLGMW
jgi:NMD protein affecting ribosome stability and mRNA decay